MIKIQLYIATTIDGFIARENGELDWLNNFSNPNSIDYGYGEFIEKIDTIVMGRKTYEEILSFGIDWPYNNQKTYIITSNQKYKTTTNKTHIINELNNKVIETLKGKSNSKIWIVGGGVLISSFIKLKAIDEMIITIIPVIIGKGIRLFSDNSIETKFKFIEAQTFDTGVVNLKYQRIK